MSLKEYVRKRDFRKSAEPAAARGKTSGQFVIQKHDASRLHYDFRLEMDGTLKSWAVPKGLPLKHGEKHLAVQVEDHPVAYQDFEGIIPEGQYGGGTVMVWDRGTWQPLGGQFRKDLANGKLHFVLKGKKLLGEWYLVRMKREENQWLIIKGEEDARPVSKKSDDTSVLSGKSLKQLSAGERVWSTAPKRNSRSHVGGAAGIPKFVEPMKARLVAKPPAGSWIYEIKFDGWRALALKGTAGTRLMSRNEKDFSSKFPEIVESIAALGARDAILDGEIVVLDKQGRSSFQALQAFEDGEQRLPVFFYVFDLLRLDGKDLTALPLLQRKELLEKLLAGAPGVLRYSAALGGDAKSLLGHVRKFGLEGLIGKKAGSHYEAGKRSGAWIKLKLHREQEFVIGGYTEPEGSRSHFGALIVGVYENKKLMFSAKVGTGFDARLLHSLHEGFQKIRRDVCPFVNLPAQRGGKWGQGITKADMALCHWVDPVTVCQVKFGEWTRDGHLRQPVFLGLREDKNPKEVVREQSA